VVELSEDGQGLSPGDAGRFGLADGEAGVAEAGERVRLGVAEADLGDLTDAISLSGQCSFPEHLIAPGAIDVDVRVGDSPRREPVVPQHSM
jgi:hypothetical protein